MYYVNFFQQMIANSHFLICGVSEYSNICMVANTLLFIFKMSGCTGNLWLFFFFLLNLFLNWFFFSFCFMLLGAFFFQKSIILRFFHLHRKIPNKYRIICLIRQFTCTHSYSCVALSTFCAVTLSALKVFVYTSYFSFLFGQHDDLPCSDWNCGC